MSTAAYQAAYSAAHKEKRAAYDAAYQPAYQAAHKEEIAAHKRARTYGISINEWGAMLAAQGNQCAICGTTEPGGRNWNTDHCHKSGRVRGLLCRHCNLGLGHFRDDPNHLVAAIEYLAAHRDKVAVTA